MKEVFSLGWTSANDWSQMFALLRCSHSSPSWWPAPRPSQSNACPAAVRFGQVRREGAQAETWLRQMRERLDELQRFHSQAESNLRSLPRGKRGNPGCFLGGGGHGDGEAGFVAFAAMSEVARLIWQSFARQRKRSCPS